MTAPDPHLFGAEGELDEEAERVVSALASLFGAPRWRIDSDRSGEFVASKLRAASAELAEAREDAAEWERRIDAWLEERTRRARATEEWATALLTDWLRRLNEADEKVKSRVLPSATVSSRAGSLEWIVDDPAAVLAWAAENGADDLVVTHVAGVSALAKVLHADEASGRVVTHDDGELVPGLRVQRRSRTFTVKPA